MSGDFQKTLIDLHYGEKSKLDYFILSADIAFLGWTVVNTNWLPTARSFVYGVTASWVLAVISIVCGIVSRHYRVDMFGTNFQMNQVSRTISQGETALAQNARFLNPDGSETPKEEVQSSIKMYKSAKELGEEKFKCFGYWADKLSMASIIFLVLALVVFSTLKVFVLLHVGL